MDRWKSRGGKRQRREEQKREDQRRERVRRKKMQAREKVAKSRNTVFFQRFVVREGRKVGLLKRRVRSHVARWEMQKLHASAARSTFPSQNSQHVQSTPGSESTFGSCDVEKVHAVVARSTFPSQNAQTHQGRSTFGSWDVEKVHAVVARSTFPSQIPQHVQRTPGSEHFWKCGEKHISKSKCTKHTRVGALLEVEIRKSARRCGAKHISKSKCTNQGRSTFRSWDVEKVHAVVARRTFPSQIPQHVQRTPGSEHFWNLGCRKSADVVLRGRHKGLCTLSKVSKTWGFSSMSKNVGRCGTFEEDLERCIFRGRRSKRDMFIRDVRRSGRWFPERGCILEHQIFSFGKMILCDRRSTLYDLASLFRGGRNTSETWAGKTAKRIGTRLSALHSTFHHWRKSRRIALFSSLRIADRQIDT